jgi:hypothetical protein
MASISSKRRLIDQARDTKYVWIRAGDEHRFIGIWIVVVEGRIFVRSWNAKQGGWHEAFLESKRGSIRFAKNGEEFPVRAIRTRSDRLKSAVEDAYAAKYTTPANRKYVKGFRTASRRDTTTELIPV